MHRRAIVATFAATVVLGAVTPSAAADGLPVPVDQTWGAGVVSADGESRFVTLPAGDSTLVLRIATDGGQVIDSTPVGGDFTVPAIAIDGTASGISADGGTLALIKPRQTFPRTRTEFRIYQADKLRQDPIEVTLDGDFSYDALSPDGETMYVIEYPDPRDPGTYQVRAYDIASGALGADAILDTEEEPGEMRGFPQTRVTSGDGAWEYTLYDGGEHPFIHALNVIEGPTVCIDLDMIHKRDTYGAKLQLSEDGSKVEVVDRKGEMRAVVDRETHIAAEPEAEPDDETAAGPAQPDGAGLEAAGIAAGGLVLMAIAGIGFRRMRR